MKPIRVLQIVPNMQQGGLENFIMNIYRNIDRQKVQFDFLVHYQKRQFFDNEIEKLGGKIYRFSLRDDNNIIKYIIELNKFYREQNEYKVIHCHMSSIGFINFLIAKKNGIKVRIAHSHNSSTDKTVKGRIKRIMMLPYKYVSTLNYACSNDAGRYLYGNKKYIIIPNAIDTDKFKFNEDKRKKYKEKLNINDKQFVIGHIGRFNIQKNHKFIISVFNKYLKINNEAILLLIGDGELLKEIKSLCKKLNIEKSVIFMRNIKNIYDYYNIMDLFILPSFFEGLPVVGIEAQTNGLNCLFSDNITEEVKVSDKVEYLKLNCDVWVKKIDEYSKKNQVDRINSYKKILNSKFEITKLAKEMEKNYIHFFCE